MVAGLHEVLADVAETGTAVFRYMAELLLELSGTFCAACCQSQQLLIPLALFDVPQVHAGNIADINGSEFAEEDGCEER
jgi:hypothetical protein